MNRQNPLVTKILEKDLKKAEKAFGKSNGSSEPQTYEEKVGRRLKMAMAYRNMSGVELSKRSGVHRQTIWRYTTGKVGQQFGPLADMAKILNVSLDFLAFGGEIMERQR